MRQGENHKEMFWSIWVCVSGEWIYLAFRVYIAKTAISRPHVAGNRLVQSPRFKSLFSYTNSMEQNPSWGSNSHSASQETQGVFYETRRFITVFKTDHHLPLSWARWIHSTPSHPIYSKSFSKLSQLVFSVPLYEL